MSRVASDTIKGYLYQFLTSFNQILSNPNGTIIVEGEIEDIDIEKENGEKQAIQCKYYESQVFSISSILPAILELYLNFKNNKALNKNYKYKLFVHIKENKSPSKGDIVSLIAKTKNEDNIIKYLSNLYIIEDVNIKQIIDKPKKSNDEKKKIRKYIDDNRNKLSFSISFDSFWENFEYIISSNFDDLLNEVKEKINETIGNDIGDLYYSNGISKIAELSAKSDVKDRTINCGSFINDLKDKKQLLYTKWSSYSLNFESVKKNLKNNIKGIMSCNAYVRAIYLAEKFCENNIAEIHNYIIGYKEKYYKKPALNKKPIFIFENESQANNVIKKLFSSGVIVNNGRYNNSFEEEWLMRGLSMQDNAPIIILIESDLEVSTIQKIKINYMFIISDKIINKFDCISAGFINLNLKSLDELRYITQL